MWTEKKNKHLFNDGEITLYRRGKVWNARIRNKHISKRISLSTKELDEAKRKSLALRKDIFGSAANQIEKRYRVYVMFSGEMREDEQERICQERGFLNFGGFWGDEDDGLKRVYVYERKTLLYHRDDKPDGIINARIRRPDKKGYKYQSFGTREWSSAFRRSHVRFRELRERHRMGLPLDNHRFEFVWNKWMDDTSPRRTENRNNQFQRTAELYFFKFFNKHNFAVIKEKTIGLYWDWRLNYWISGPGSESVSPQAAINPKAATLAQERDALNQLFKWALRHSYISRRPEIDLPIKYERTRRPALPHEKFVSFPIIAMEYIEGGQRAYDRWHRAHTAFFGVFCLYSGLRPREAKLLRWQDLKLFKDAEGQEQLLIIVHPDTKTKGRECVPLQKTIDLIVEWRNDWARQIERDSYVFGSWDGNYLQAHGRGIEKLFKALKITHDNFGRKRSAYSFRHTYATERLLNGVGVYELAKNMGTSVEMIEKHYGHVTNQMNAVELTKIRHAAESVMLIPDYNTTIEETQLSFIDQQ